MAETVIGCQTFRGNFGLILLPLAPRVIFGNCIFLNALKVRSSISVRGPNHFSWFASSLPFCVPPFPVHCQETIPLCAYAFQAGFQHGSVAVAEAEIPLVCVHIAGRQRALIVGLSPPDRRTFVFIWARRHEYCFFFDLFLPRPGRWCSMLALICNSGPDPSHGFRILLAHGQLPRRCSARAMDLQPGSLVTRRLFCCFPADRHLPDLLHQASVVSFAICRVVFVFFCFEVRLLPFFCNALSLSNRLKRNHFCPCWHISFPRRRGRSQSQPSSNFRAGP